MKVGVAGRAHGGEELESGFGLYVEYHLSMSGRLSVLLAFVFAGCVESAVGQARIEPVGSDSVNLGRYNAWEKRTAVYAIRNAGDEPLVIGNIRKTCGCATARIDKTLLNPGETGRVDVVILPNSISGRYSKNVFVESNDPGKRFLMLSVSGDAVPLVDSEPGLSVNEGRMSLAEPWSRVFTLRPSLESTKLGEPLVESSWPVDSEMALDDELNTYRLKLSMKAGGESGDFNCRVKVPVVFPEGLPPIEVTVSGQRGYMLQVVPGIVFLPVSDGPVERSLSLSIPGRRSRVLTLDEVFVSREHEVSLKPRPDFDGLGLGVTAVFSPGFTRKVNEGEPIRVILKVPGAGSAAVVCKSLPKEVAGISE